jgi:hypothetical protein
MDWDDLKFLYESRVSKEDSHLDWLKFSSNFDSIVRRSILSCVKFVIYCMSMENCVFGTWYELGEKCVFEKNYVPILNSKFFEFKTLC